MNLALQKTDSDDSSTSGQSDGDDSELLMPGLNTPEQARVQEASNHSSLDATRPGASSPKANSFVSHAAFEELLQKSMEWQTNAILDAVLLLNEKQARRGTADVERGHTLNLSRLLVHIIQPFSQKQVLAWSLA